MRIKKQTTYNINSDKFKYLEREVNNHLNRVDINDLNKRLNITKRSNFYTTSLFAILGLSCLVILSLIGFRF